MVETITTVGYGDYQAYNIAENLYLIVIMFAGVISFSYATGSLSSIISSIDSREASEQERIMILNGLRDDYGEALTDELYHKLRLAILFDSKKKKEQTTEFIVLVTRLTRKTN